MRKVINRNIISTSLDKSLIEKRCDTPYVSTLEPSKAIPLINSYFSSVLIDEMLLGKIITLERQLEKQEELADIPIFEVL